MPASRIRKTWPNTDRVTRALASLFEVASGYDAIVFDQWGVLHDGSAPYPLAVETLHALKADGQRLAVLSNSGKRADANERQLGRIGFARDLFASVMTSGEVLWRAIAAGEIPQTKFHAITRTPGDEEIWADGLDLTFCPVETAEAVLLMGLADDSPPGTYDATFAAALDRGLPLLCSNPDRTAPRAGGVTVVMPGTLAHQYAAAGGEVQFFGKPYPQVFRAVEATLNLQSERILMVGDSLEHDIAGAERAGWQSLFIRGGLHAGDFGTAPLQTTLADLARPLGVSLPEFTLDTLR